MNQQITGVIGWLIIGVLLYVFGRIMRAAGERRGFAQGCRSEREYNHRRVTKVNRTRGFWFSQN